MITNDQRMLKSLAQRMWPIIQFFESRDDMNGHLHLETTRYSPITNEARKIRDELELLAQ